VPKVLISGPPNCNKSWTCQWRLSFGTI